MAAPNYNPAMGMAPGVEPPEVSSLKSLLNISRIVTLIFLVIGLLVGVATIAILIAFAGALGIFGVWAILWFIVDLVIFIQIGNIRDMVNAGQLQAAKDKMLIWWILGFIFGGVIVGILLLVTWLKFDSAIAAVQRQQSMTWQQPPAAPVWQAPPGAAPAPAAAPMAPTAGAPAAAPGTPQATTCPRCGRPATWIAQYSRWYCYNDQQYV